MDGETEDGHRWSATIEPLEAEEDSLPDPEDVGLRLYEVAVTVETRRRAKSEPQDTAPRSAVMTARFASSGSPKSQRQAGFTLLELLIAFTLLALIMTALTGGLRFAGKAWEGGEARARNKGRPRPGDRSAPPPIDPKPAIGVAGRGRGDRRPRRPIPYL